MKKVEAFMATTPVPISTTPGNPISRFLKTHEYLIIFVLCLIVGVHFYSKVISAWETHDQRVADAAHATLQANVATAQQIATVNAQAAAQYQQLATQLAASNKALATAQATRNTATQNQQTIDRTLPPNELATRWTTLLKMDPQTVLVEPGGKEGPDALVITPEGARETVVQLESVPTLQANLKDEQTIVANQDTQIGNLAGVNVGLNKQIDALNVVNAAEIKACTDDKNLLKAKARKSKLKWFFGGFIVGFVTRQVVKTYTGV
jgi:hypothetical protein